MSIGKKKRMILQRLKVIGSSRDWSDQIAVVCLFVVVVVFISRGSTTTTTTMLFISQEMFTIRTFFSPFSAKSLSKLLPPSCSGPS